MQQVQVRLLQPDIYDAIYNYDNEYMTLLKNLYPKYEYTDILPYRIFQTTPDSQVTGRFNSAIVINNNGELVNIFDILGEKMKKEYNVMYKNCEILKNFMLSININTINLLDMGEIIIYKNNKIETTPKTTILSTLSNIPTRWGGGGVDTVKINNKTYKIYIKHDNQFMTIKQAIAAHQRSKKKKAK